jgi:diguanylate cyclase (GGDEF)-like protein
MSGPFEHGDAAAVRGFAPNQEFRAQMVATAQTTLFGLAILVIALTWNQPTSWWDPLTFLIIAALTITSELSAVRIAGEQLHFSASFLGLVLAAVLLGGGPAAIIGIATIAIGWIHSKEAPRHLLTNVLMFAWFPLISGLLFHAIVSPVDAQRVLSAHTPSSTYFLLVFATFGFALTLNVTMVVLWQWVLDGRRPLARAKYFKPLIAPELLAAPLTLIAVYLRIKLDDFGLIMFALVLVMFQYLVGELLISQQRAADLRRLASTDELTGLANRKQFGERLDAEIEACRTTGEAFGVILLDLDRFKEINDTLGHHYGDQLLAQLGPRLADQFGPDGIVARLGGDEFAVLTGRRTDRADVLGEAASDLIACVHQPIMIGDISLEIGSSVGIARYPIDGDDAQTLLRRADIAMYLAKEHRDGFRLYQPEHDYHSTRRLRIIGDFRRALARDEIVVHFQPIVDLRHDRVRGAEALIRWQHPKLGLLEPGMFLQIVEQTGLIGELTTRVLDRAIGECARWRASGLDLTVAVNLSVRNLHDPLLPGLISRTLDRYSVPAGALQLEITESMIMSDPARAIATVRRISDLGVGIAVDDFGTGHSSLANLKRLPIDELKIDRSFVTPMLADESDLIIVRSTVNLAHDLGLKVIAEGVEDAATLHQLALLGCDLAQGHHLSVPKQADAFATWLAQAISSSRPTISSA